MAPNFIQNKSQSCLFLQWPIRQHIWHTHISDLTPTTLPFAHSIPATQASLSVPQTHQDSPGLRVSVLAVCLEYSFPRYLHNNTLISFKSLFNDAQLKFQSALPYPPPWQSLPSFALLHLYLHIIYHFVTYHMLQANFQNGYTSIFSPCAFPDLAFLHQEAESISLPFESGQDLDASITRMQGK